MAGFSPMCVKGIEVVVRGVLARSGQVLLVHTRGASNTYLPGGHVEFDEPASGALKREILEELGYAARVIRFLGTVEHSWTESQNRSHEINLIFQMDLDCPGPGETVRSREKKIEFFWKALDELDKAKLEPRVLRRLLPLWLRSRARGRYGSTLVKPKRRRG